MDAWLATSLYDTCPAANHVFFAPVNYFLTGSLGGALTRGGTVSEPGQRSSELEEAAREYVARLKEAYPGINERDLYALVYEIARQRVEEAER